MNEMQPLTAEELLENIFHCMSKLVVEKDFYESIRLLTELGRTLTNAHRASFWYKDEKQHQYWTLAASGTERITIPEGTGIVGASIENKETILINNPYEDSRFNSDVDKQTGYLTKSILCMPVTNSMGEVIGAYQVINKVGTDENCAFRRKDVKALSMAAAYCGKTLEAQLLKEQKLVDQLTGLKNRRGFYECYNEKFLGADRADNNSIIISDIDFFKKVNDTYGHNIGDEVLIFVSKLLKDITGDLGEVFRWGGEEFIILLPGSDLSHATTLAENIRTQIEESVCECKDVNINVTMSFGVAEIDVEKKSVDNIKNADSNLYRAKQAGRNKVVSGSVDKRISAGRLFIVPDIDNMDEILELSRKYDLAFEYNDFYNPEVLESEELQNQIHSIYAGIEKKEICTLHGAFYDVVPFSMDKRIREVSLLRIEQSIEHAKKLGARAVVFHTNYNPYLNSANYIKSWIENNIHVWSEILEQNSDIQIYLENMFDTTPDILLELAKALSKYENFGICLDYAHAVLSDVEPEVWAKELSPYIKHVHINDNDLISDLHMAWGDGKMDRQSFYKCYNKYMGDATILIETTTIPNIRRSLDILMADGFC